MELWLRHHASEGCLYWERRETVGSQEEWRALISDPKVISSILWPTGPVFPLSYRHIGRRHHHETYYQHDPERNEDFRAACQRLAERLDDVLQGQRALVYAPLRGAYPIWRCITQYLTASHEVYYPVTSSFVMYPKDSPIQNPSGSRASGRFNNKQELRRIRPFLRNYDVLVYVDEIISGGMMRGHTKEMVEQGIHEEIPLVVVGLADSNGSRSEKRRSNFESQVKRGVFRAFLWEGCRSLITEDQKFLLGIHYVDYQSGPHIVPLLDGLEPYEEKALFDAQVMR